RKRGIRIPVESAHQRRYVIFRLGYVHAREPDSLASPRERIQKVEPFFEGFGEFRGLFRRAVEKAVETGEPVGVDLGAVDPTPLELRRHVFLGDSAAEPE